MTDFQWGLAAGSSIILLVGIIIFLVILLLREDSILKETEADDKIKKNVSDLSNGELDALLSKDLAPKPADNK